MKNLADTDPLALLHDDFLSVPKDFEQQVMQQIAAASPVKSAPKKPQADMYAFATSLWRRRFAWLALASSLLLGMGQVLSFVFSLWTLSAAI